MLRTSFTIHRQLQLALNWYGSDYDFYRPTTNAYGEPSREGSLVQTVVGVYHSSEQNFIELLNSEGASVKAKTNKGIFCDISEELNLQQGDYVVINERTFWVTTIEPISYNDQVVAYEISLEEFVEGNSHD